MSVYVSSPASVPKHKTYDQLIVEAMDGLDRLDDAPLAEVLARLTASSEALSQILGMQVDALQPTIPGIRQ